MSYCAQCGVSLTDERRDLCMIHDYPLESWAATNKIWCDYFHRGIEPTRLPLGDRGMCEGI